MQNDAISLENSLKTSYHTLSNPTPLYLPEGTESLHTHRNLHKQLMVALFITVTTWEQLRCPSVGKETDELWHIQTMG